jgi:hypothetical protein
LPTPGTSSISRWPLARMQAIASRICRVLPRMIWLAGRDHRLGGIRGEPAARVDQHENRNLLRALQFFLVCENNMFNRGFEMLRPCSGPFCSWRCPASRKRPALQRHRHVVEPDRVGWAVSMQHSTRTTRCTRCGTRTTRASRSTRTRTTTSHLDRHDGATWVSPPRLWSAMRTYQRHAYWLPYARACSRSRRWALHVPFTSRPPRFHLRDQRRRPGLRERPGLRLPTLTGRSRSGASTFDDRAPHASGLRAPRDGRASPESPERLHRSSPRSRPRA